MASAVRLAERNVCYGFLYPPSLSLHFSLLQFCELGSKGYLSTLWVTGHTLYWVTTESYLYSAQTSPFYD